MKTVELTKGRHRHIVRYEPGDESGVFLRLVEMMHDKEIDFDWVDVVAMWQLIEPKAMVVSFGSSASWEIE